MLSNITHQLLSMVNMFSPPMRFIFAIFIGGLLYVSLFFINKSLGFNIKNYNMNIVILASIDIVYLSYTYYRTKNVTDDISSPSRAKQSNVENSGNVESAEGNDEDPSKVLSKDAILEELTKEKERLSPIREGTNEDVESPRNEEGEFPSRQNTEEDESKFVETNEKGELIES